MAAGQSACQPRRPPEGSRIWIAEELLKGWNGGVVFNCFFDCGIFRVETSMIYLDAPKAIVLKVTMAHPCTGFK